jgi:hypothetical protein
MPSVCFYIIPDCHPLLIMASLWTCDDSKRWQGTLDRYEEACGAVPKKGDKLLPLDR